MTVRSRESLEQRCLSAWVTPSRPGSGGSRPFLLRAAALAPLFVAGALLPGNLQADAGDPDPEPAGTDTTTSVRAAPAAQDPPFTIGFGLAIQSRYTYLDPEAGDATGSFEVRRLRPSVSGEAYGTVSYRAMFELAGGAARLLDGWLAYEISPELRVSTGQAKAPFGRQQLVSSSRLQFVDRALTDRRFNPGRHPGLWVNGAAADGAVEYSAGVYNGEGVNVRNEDGDYLTAARVVWAPLGAYALAESALDRPEEPRLALGLAMMGTTMDHVEGEVETTTDVLRVNVEAAFKLGGLNAVGEYTWERSSPEPGGEHNTSGWYSQLAYLFPAGYELALRYATILPETLLPDEIEWGIGVSRYLQGHDMKIQADLLHFDRGPSAEDNLIRAQVQMAF